MEAARINPEHAQKPDPEEHQKSNPEQVRKLDLEPASETLVDGSVISVEEKNENIKQKEDTRRKVEAMANWFQALQSDIAKIDEHLRTMKPPYYFQVYDLKPDPKPIEDDLPIDHCARCERRAVLAAMHKASGKKRARGED